MSTRIPTPAEILRSPGLANKGLKYITKEREKQLLHRFELLYDKDGPEQVILPAKTFETTSYYIGKELLESLFAHDFADFDGIHISFGREPTAEGRLVLLFRGMFKPTSDQELENFSHQSRRECMATYEEGGGGPINPAIVRNPPYGKDNVASDPEP